MFTERKLTPLDIFKSNIYFHNYLPKMNQALAIYIIIKMLYAPINTFHIRFIRIFRAFVENVDTGQ